MYRDQEITDVIKKFKQMQAASPKSLQFCKSFLVGHVHVLTKRGYEIWLDKDTVLYISFTHLKTK